MCGPSNLSWNETLAGKELIFAKIKDSNPKLFFPAWFFMIILNEQYIFQNTSSKSD